MYKIKCEKEFDFPLEIPSFAERYNDLIKDDSRKKIVYVKGLKTEEVKLKNLEKRKWWNGLFHNNTFSSNSFHMLFNSSYIL